MQKFNLFVMSLGIIFLTSEISWTNTPESKSIEGIEFLTGYGRGKVHVSEPKENYNIIPFAVSFDFNLKPLTQKFNFSPAALLQFQIEPFISYIYQPETNIEAGTSFFLKAGLLPQTSRFQPYLKAGAGLVYLTQHTREQSTQFNFTQQAGIGMHYFFGKDIAFTVDYRFRHLSNADIEKPNRGIDAYFALTGITYKF